MNLIQILTAFVVAYLEGAYPLKQLNKVMNPANRAHVLEDLPGMRNAFTAYDNGEEIDWIELAEVVKAYAAQYAKTSGSKVSFLNALKAFTVYYRNSSDNALKQIYKLSAIMEDDYLHGYFVREQVDQGAVLKKLVPLVKKLGGTGRGLTLEESKAAKDSSPELYKEYLGLQRQFNEAWKAAIDAYVRSTGDNNVPISAVLNHLKKKGIEHNMPTGFTGRIDALGQWYSITGDIINGGAPSAVMFPQVRMNPEFGPSNEDTWVFQAIRSDGTPGNYFYTAKFRKAKHTEKFQKVAAFDLAKTRKKWLPLLKKFNPDQPDINSVAALIIEILYRTSNRVGSVQGGNSEGGGFGISTLQVRHFYPQSDGSVKFLYSGKDSVKTVAVIKKNEDLISRQVCEMVFALAEGKKPKEPLFTYGLKNGSYKPVNAAIVNKLFKMCAGADVTVHKLRTAKGSELFSKYLDDLYAKRKTMNEAQVKEAWMKGGAIVGKQLNHVRRSVEGDQKVQPATSLKNYIDPMLQADLFQHYGAPMPKMLESLLGEAVYASVQQSIKAAKIEEVARLMDQADVLPEVNDAHDDGIYSDNLIEEVFSEGPEVLETAEVTVTDVEPVVDLTEDEDAVFSVTEPQEEEKAEDMDEPTPAAPVAPLADQPAAPRETATASAEDPLDKKIETIAQAMAKALLQTQAQLTPAAAPVQANRKPWNFEIEYDEKGRVSNLIAKPKE